MLLPSLPVCRLLSLGLLIAWVLALGACSTGRTSGFYHTVARGENLYRIGLRYGVPTEVLIEANHIRDVRSVPAGTRLWIPRTTFQFAEKSSKSSRGATARGSEAATAQRLARLEAQRNSKLRFDWPVRGKLTSHFGRRRGRPHDGVDLAARKGTPIRAAESGRVIHSGRLGDYGKVVILKHAGYYRTVYAHASKTLVRRGQFVEKGQKIALVGNSGRSSGPHLHFEIRKRESPTNPIPYLP